MTFTDTSFDASPHLFFVFSSVGPNYRVDHDISLIVPELWCRMTPEERDPKIMIEKGFLEPIEDFEYEGRAIPASRLGYRITKRFVHYFFCRIFDNPSGVIPDDMLQPETQDLAVFVDGIENIAQAMENSAKLYFQDNIIEDACPPLRAVLHVMAYGHYNGKSIKDPEIRAMFTREALLQSNWYQARLAKKQMRDITLGQKNVAYLEEFLARPGYAKEAQRLGIAARLDEAGNQLDYVKSSKYLASLVGTLGADPIHDGYVMVDTTDGSPPTDVVTA
jgi:phosphoenolpyruvate carboxykinase (diphosphate)